MDLNDGKILGTLECSLVLERHLLEIVFNASQSFVKRSIALATKYHSCQVQDLKLATNSEQVPNVRFGSGRSVEIYDRVFLGIFFTVLYFRVSF